MEILDMFSYKNDHRLMIDKLILMQHLEDSRYYVPKIYNALYDVGKDFYIILVWK